MYDDLIPAIDGYLYRVKKDHLDDGLCIQCINKKYYTVYPDRYIIGIDNYLYKIATKNSSVGITIKGRGNKEYYVENNPMDFEVNSNTDHLKEFECDRANPIPVIKYDGKETPECRAETGICDINVPDGVKFSIGRRKGFNYFYDGSKAWLERE